MWRSRAREEHMERTCGTKQFCSARFLGAQTYWRSRWHWRGEGKGPAGGAATAYVHGPGWDSLQKEATNFLQKGQINCFQSLAGTGSICSPQPCLGWAQCLGLRHLPLSSRDGGEWAILKAGNRHQPCQAGHHLLVIKNSIHVTPSFVTCSDSAFLYGVKKRDFFYTNRGRSWVERTWLSLQYWKIPLASADVSLWPPQCLSSSPLGDAKPGELLIKIRW